MPFDFVPTRLHDVVNIVPRRFSDERGWFAEVYKYRAFRSYGIPDTFVQDNDSVSARGTVRGLHYQLPPFAQGKLVRVVHGTVWDVAVDIRRSSPTFGEWVGVELNADTGNMLWIPEGFAHGFVALDDDTHLTYKCTAEYDKPSERAIRWNDPDVAIEWPEIGTHDNYLLSERDAAAGPFRDAEVYP